MDNVRASDHEITNHQGGQQEGQRDRRTGPTESTGQKGHSTPFLPGVTAHLPRLGQGSSVEEETDPLRTVHKTLPWGQGHRPFIVNGRSAFHAEVAKRASNRHEVRVSQKGERHVPPRWCTLQWAHSVSVSARKQGCTCTAGMRGPRGEMQ